MMVARKKKIDQRLQEKREDIIIPLSERLVLEVLKLWAFKADTVFIVNEIANKYAMLISTKQIEKIIKNKSHK